jgi:hypothetical protein
MSRHVIPSSFHPFTSLSALCPLCGEELALGLPDNKVSARWREALSHRDKWAEISAQFRVHQSVDGAAAALSITPELAHYLLRFLCLEVCGCRAATCVSCLDDYRDVL